MSKEWLNQQTKSEAQLRRENTAMQAELLQAQVRLQKLSELSAENTRLRGLLDTPFDYRWTYGNCRSDWNRC